LGDSAYTPSPTMVPAYKKFGKQVTLASGQTFFDDFLSSSHSMIEKQLEFEKVDSIPQKCMGKICIKVRHQIGR
jgi:hypothetical protein